MLSFEAQYCREGGAVYRLDKKSRTDIEDFDDPRSAVYARKKRIELRRLKAHEQFCWGMVSERARSRPMQSRHSGVYVFFLRTGRAKPSPSG